MGLHRRNKGHWHMCVSHMVVYIHIPMIKRLKVMWEEEDILAKKSAGIGMELGEGKNTLIKNDITGNIDTACGYIKAFYTLVTWTIAKENTLLRAKS